MVALILKLALLLATAGPQDPDTPPVPEVVQRAIAQYDAGEVEAARAALTALLTTQPDDHDALLAAARFLCIDRRDFATGEPLARRLVELKPDVADSYYPMFSCLLGANDGDEYTRLCEQAIARIPEDSLLYFHLGVAHRLNLKRLEALAAFEKSIALDPTRAAAYYQAGGVALAVRRYEQAEQLFREALRRNPDDVDAHWQLGRVLKYQGRDKEAEQSFLTAVKSGSATAEYEYGVFLFEADRLDEAARVLQSCVLKDPASRMGWHYLARTHRLLGNRGKADTAMERFRELQKQRDEQDEAAMRRALFGESRKAEGQRPGNEPDAGTDPAERKPDPERDGGE